MSDGKISPKRDIVILSIKPKRPEYPPDKKYVLAKAALQEWDKLDAYYRGQILKLKTLSSSKNNKAGFEHDRSTSRKSSNNSNSRSSSRSSSKKSTSSRRSTTSGTQLTELFGDENIPLDDFHLGSGSEDFLSDTDIEISLGRNNNKSCSLGKKVVKEKKRLKKKHNNKSGKEGSLEEGSVEDDENYLSVPRDNFVIEFAIVGKKRTPVHNLPEGSRSPNVLNPIKVQRYKPPVAMGFNVVHISKILYHKTEGVVHTSPTTTTAPTPDKPPDSERSTSSSPSLSVCSGSSGGSNEKLDQLSFIDDTPLISGKSRMMTSGARTSVNNNKNNNNTTAIMNTSTNTTNNNNNNSPGTAAAHSHSHSKKSSKTDLFYERSSYGTNDKYHKSGSNNVNSVNNVISSSQKRKLEQTAAPSTDPNIPNSKHDRVSNSVSSTTSSVTCFEDCGPVGKKAVYSEDGSGSSKERKKEKDRLMMGPPSSIPLKSVSITESIIKKAKEGYKTSEMKERERRRRLECQQRKRYAIEKGDEQQFNDLVDASMKALEMATTYPLLSPIRSP